MRHLTPTHWTVEKLVQSFANGEIAIPEIQREYVWDDDQVKNLLDSIDNDYPCGSIILWEPGRSDAKLVRDLIKPERRKRYEDNKRTPKYFLLDGQQRITSLASILMNRERFREMLPDLEPEDLPSRLYGNLRRFPNEIMAMSDGQAMGRENWMLLNDLFDPMQAGNPQIAALKEDQKRKIYEYVQRIRNYQFAVEIIHERDYATVGKIFERVNSSATQLEGAEIHLARIVPYWKGIAGKFREFCDQLAARDYDLDITFLMRSITSVQCGVGKIEKLANKVTGTDKHGNKLVTERELDQSWTTAKKAIERVVKVLETELLLDKTKFIPSKNVLVPLVYYAANDKSSSLSHKDIVRFFVFAQLSGFYSESTETRLTRTIKDLNGSNGTIREALRDLVSAMRWEAKQEYPRLKIKPEDVCGSPGKNPLVLLMYILMRQKDASDFLDGKVTLDLISPKETHLHHIFPWDFMMKDKRALKMCEMNGFSRGEYREIVNDIANLTFLRQSTNSSIGKCEPAEYLKDIPADIRRTHFIPDDPAIWHPERYEDFLEARRTLIADGINRFLRSLG
jgi:hypothetical protein